MFDSTAAVLFMPDAAIVAAQAVRNAQIRAYISCIFRASCVPGHDLAAAVESGAIGQAEADAAVRSRFPGVDCLQGLVSIETERMEHILKAWGK